MKIKRFTQILLFLNAFLIEAEFRKRAFEDKTVDFQIAIKLALWVVVLAATLFYARLWAKKLMRIDNVFQLFLLFDILISCFYAPNPFYSFGCLISLVAVLFLLLMASSVLTTRELLLPIIYGCSMVSFISIIAYYVSPDTSRMKDWVGAHLVIGTRLEGITGAANTMGYISALCLLGLYYVRHMIPRINIMYVLLVLVNAAALYMSNSRTSMAALVISIGAASLMRPTPLKILAVCAAICFAIVIYLGIDTNTLFSMLARSGSADEIESATGRTAIWRVTLELISQRPWFGWGYSASTYLLPEHAKEVGFSVNQTHNAFLQTALSVGIIGLFLFVSLMTLKVFYSVRSGEQLNLAFITFLLIDGITEPIAFVGVATTTTLALAMVLALNYREPHEADHSPYQQRLS